MPKLGHDLDFRDAGAFSEAEDSRRRDAKAHASGGPVDPEAMRHADGLTVSAEEAAAYREHVERGARQQGEGAPIF
ncbi:hypothetical protein CcI49_21565 [Frankia sp. CcI49]|uniref:hypothetical protein n=1 Tax=Frankiaceae TaxID=74712 RepID=UPI0001C4680A|nr:MULTISPECIES: hypothetical protein [Frankiaceae]EFC80954.1 hypothetical protein FrEUN1fDRAFT_5923 [Parafrankia sp. EUN1f]KPM52949.1 hypothetical protein ACG83_26375 [Frankia sp. R43]ONH58541.1 hypothetical protein CcI49_21565 [Frankia sp. CcI49]